MSADLNVALYLDPPSHHFLADRLFADGDGGRLNGDHVNAPYVHLRRFLAERGVPCHTIDHLPSTPDSRRKIYVSMGTLDNYRRLAGRPDVSLSAIFAMECPIADPALYRGLPEAQKHFRRVYSWSDNVSLRRFTGAPLRCRPFCWPQPFADVHEQIWRRTERRFLALINANKVPCLRWQELYSERLRAVEYFGRRNEIDLYGVGWDGPPFRLSLGHLPGTAQRMLRELERRWRRVRPDPLLRAAQHAYRGPVASKRDTLGQYTFSICFENMILKGWITEKIFDCFYAGTVPIYWGSPDIAARIPAECFIDMRQYAGYDDLAAFLKSRRPQDIQRYREAARAFLRSPAFAPFSSFAFVDRFREIIGEDAAVSLEHGVPTC